MTNPTHSSSLPLRCELTSRTCFTLFFILQSVLCSLIPIFPLGSPYVWVIGLLVGWSCPTRISLKTCQYSSSFIRMLLMTFPVYFLHVHYSPLHIIPTLQVFLRPWALPFHRAPSHWRSCFVGAQLHMELVHALDTWIPSMKWNTRKRKEFIGCSSRNLIKPLDLLDSWDNSDPSDDGLGGRLGGS